MRWNAWPVEKPGYAYNTITGVEWNHLDPSISWLHPDATGTDPQALLYRDTDRDPAFNNRGEILSINPRSYAEWQKDPRNLLYRQYIWQIATNPSHYERFGARPTFPGDVENVRTPVDLLLMGPQQTILHEVSTISFDRLFIPVVILFASLRY